MKRPLNGQYSKCIQGNTTSFQRQMILQGNTKLCMVEVLRIITLIPQLHDMIAVY